MFRSRIYSLLCAGLATAGVALADSGAAASDGVENHTLPATADTVCDPLFDDACDESDASKAQFPDPWESYNRVVFAFNGGFDRFVLDPITFVYQALLPDPVQSALLRAVRNLDAPSIVINDGLQLEWWDALVTIERFVLNTTLGLGGLFDPAAELGIDEHDSDFGQTLALAEVPSGPYVVLPIFGPTTVRGATGLLADAAMSPLLYILGPLSFEIWRQGSQGIALRADNIRELQTLEKESIDFYAALRSAYYQNRQAEIWQRREHRRPTGQASPEPEF